MKQLSESNVITNSSSEVFILSGDNLKKFIDKDEPCITYNPLDYEWVKNNPWEAVAICEVMGWDSDDFIDRDEEVEWWWDVKEDVWNLWIENHKEEIEKKFSDGSGLWWLDIEDHYPDAEEDSEEARNLSIFSEYRH